LEKRGWGYGGSLFGSDRVRGLVGRTSMRIGHGLVVGAEMVTCTAASAGGNYGIPATHPVRTVGKTVGNETKKYPMNGVSGGEGVSRTKNEKRAEKCLSPHRYQHRKKCDPRPGSAIIPTPQRPSLRRFCPLSRAQSAYRLDLFSNPLGSLQSKSPPSRPHPPPGAHFGRVIASLG
jgi:hypothetical protein